MADAKYKRHSTKIPHLYTIQNDYCIFRTFLGSEAQVRLLRTSDRKFALDALAKINDVFNNIYLDFDRRPQREELEPLITEINDENVRRGFHFVQKRVSVDKFQVLSDENKRLQARIKELEDEIFSLKALQITKAVEPAVRQEPVVAPVTNKEIVTESPAVDDGDGELATKVRPAVYKWDALKSTMTVFSKDGSMSKTFTVDYSAKLDICEHQWVLQESRSLTGIYSAVSDTAQPKLLQYFLVRDFISKNLRSIQYVDNNPYNLCKKNLKLV
jgi:hypothetical protein